MDDAVSYIHQRSWMGSRPGLSRTLELLELLGNPHKNLKYIHVAGTNGKGSTAAMLAEILHSSGLNTGLYTSPYLHRFNERMKINGVSISDSDLQSVTRQVRPFAEGMADPPTEFELVTAVGLLYFAQQHCDIVVLEVGMGGSLDSTNVIDSPEVAVITNIGLDHTKELGNTLELIAAQKAGIVKSGCDTVLYNQTNSVTEVVKKICCEHGSQLSISQPEEIRPIKNSVEGQSFSYKGFPLLGISLLGRHQLNNTAVALKVVEVLRRKGYSISDEAVSEGLRNTKWPGRFEVVCRKPWVVVDGGHNLQCALTVSANLRTYFPNKRVVFLMGVLKDKNYLQMIDSVLDMAQSFVCVTPDNPRALEAAVLAQSVSAAKVSAVCCDTVAQGVKTAMDLAGEDGVVCSFGSLYMTGAVRECFGLGQNE